MFENLQEKLQRAFKSLRGQARLSEENIAEALREIRLALLEADVNFKVVKELIDRIQAKAVGQEVLTALSPGEQVIKIVRDELVETLGKDTARMKFSSQPPTVVLMAGLQGSGKTTTSGKLAHWFKIGGHRPLLVSVDVYRPAAREQLKIVAQAVKAQIYEGKVAADAYANGAPHANGAPEALVRGAAHELPADEGVRRSMSAEVERLAKEARREAIVSGCDVLIVDTAGRLHIDDELMNEMQSLKKLLNPSEILFVADAMTGRMPSAPPTNSTRNFRSLASFSLRWTATLAAARRFPSARSPASRSNSSASAKSTMPSSHFTPTASSPASSAWATSSR